MTAAFFATPPPDDLSALAGRIDLHTHSRCSDGTQAPADLVAAAAAAGLEVLALTDHDTVAGIGEAAAAAARHGVVLVAGMEVSTRNRGVGQHLLVYGADPAAAGYADFGALVAGGIAGRTGRVDAIVEALAGVGVVVSADAVWEAAAGAVPGRPHVADALVAGGVCTDRAEAFAKYLGAGKVGHVRRFAPEIDDVVAAATTAGGVTVVAHPWGRGTHVAEERLAELAGLGLVGVEVDHQEHDAAARDALRAIAVNLGLVVTGSSDHHGTGKVDHDLGCNTTSVADLLRLVEAAAR